MGKVACRGAHGVHTPCAGTVKWSGFCRDCYIKEFGEEQNETCMHGHDPNHVPCDECCSPDFDIKRVARAEGYAEAVADIRQMVETLHDGAVNLSAKDTFWSGGSGAVQGFARALHQVRGMLNQGAHIGAAKKGTT